MADASRSEDVTTVLTASNASTESDTGKSSQDAPGWFTPARMLAVFCTINMLNYIDRGAIASNGVNGQAAETDCDPHAQCRAGSGIQGDFNLSNFEDGLLPAAFMVGLLVASPLFALGSRHYNPFRLIGVGLTVWAFALVGCGFSTGLWTMLICRMFVGVGEASFISLAAPFIDDHAPRGSTTRWLALFYMCIPTGYALGYIFGGLVPVVFGTWRAAFWVEGLLMTPFALLGFVSKPIPLRGHSLHLVSQPSDQETTPRAAPADGKTADEEAPLHSKPKNAKAISMATMAETMLADVKVLVGNKTYVVNVIGYSLYTFVIGAYAYWGPKAAKLLFNMEEADTVFGAVTVLSGIGGTVAGGVVLDWMGGTIPNAFKLMGATTLIGGLFCLGAFLAPSTAVFIPLLVLGEFFVFAIQGPANIVSMQSVDPSLRALSIAGSTVATHLLGDVPSPPILGALQDAVANWRISMGVFTAILVPSALVWASGAFLEVSRESNPPSVFHAASEITQPIPDESTQQRVPLLPEESPSS